MQDASFDLGRYADRLEHDPGEAAEVRERLNVLNRVVQKYGAGARRLSEADDPVAAVIEKRAALRQTLAELEGEGEQGDRGGDRLAELDAELDRAGQAVDRRPAAPRRERLTPQIETQLAELGMADAKLSVDFAPVDDTPTGRDRVEIVVQTNPGQDARPLAQRSRAGESCRG